MQRIKFTISEEFIRNAVKMYVKEHFPKHVKSSVSISDSLVKMLQDAENDKNRPQITVDFDAIVLDDFPELDFEMPIANKLQRFQNLLKEIQNIKQDPQVQEKLNQSTNESRKNLFEWAIKILELELNMQLEGNSQITEDDIKRVQSDVDRLFAQFKALEINHIFRYSQWVEFGSNL